MILKAELTNGDYLTAHYSNESGAVVSEVFEEYLRLVDEGKVKSFSLGSDDSGRSAW